jgi:hypothetical protein
MEIFEFEVCRFLNKSKNEFLKNKGGPEVLLGREGLRRPAQQCTPARAGVKKKGCEPGPHVGVYSNPKGYRASLAVGFKGIGRLGLVFSDEAHAATGKTLAGTGSGRAHLGGCPVAGMTGEGRRGRRRGSKGGRGGLGRSFPRGGVGFQGRPGHLLRQRSSLVRLNGDVSGELCAGKRFVGVSRG